MGNQRKIPVEKLLPGMYVENVLNEKETFLFSADLLISGFHQIAYLKRQGVSIVYINTGKGIDIQDDEIAGCSSEVSLKPEQPFPELERAAQVNAARIKTINTVRQIMFDVKAGRLSSIRGVADVVEEMIDKVLENPDAYFGLCRISTYNDRLYTHSVNVAVLMIGLASVMGYSRDKILNAGIGGILHDLGMVRFPEDLVFLEGAYTAEEFDLIKKHPQYALEMIERSKEYLPRTCLEIIKQHHEKLNGSGYPGRLRGKQINEMASICAVADTYDMLTSDGFRRKSCIPQEALALIYQGADDNYPRTVVEYFTKLLGIYPVGSLVNLESGETGVVVKINRKNLLLPHVLVLFDCTGSRILKPFIRDLSAFSNEKERELWKVKNALDPADLGIETAEIILNPNSVKRSVE